MSAQNLNVSGQDMLLLDNSTSYFQNLGYTRTSNFQFKLKETDSQNVPRFGATTTFKIQKQDHLLGNVDLHLRIKLPSQSAIGPVPHFLTNKFGHAMIERVRFLVGSNLIQEIDGEWLDLENSLYREPEHQYLDIVGDARKRSHHQHNMPLPIDDTQHLSFNSESTRIHPQRKLFVVSKQTEYFGTVEPIMKKTTANGTVQGRVSVEPFINAAHALANPAVVENAAVPVTMPAPAAFPAYFGAKYLAHDHDVDVGGVVVAGGTGATAIPTTEIGKPKYGSQFIGNPEFVEFTVPLGLFFSKHPSMYLPLMSVASSQDITIEVRLRDLPSLMQHYHKEKTVYATGTTAPTAYKEYHMYTTPKASTKALFFPAAMPEIDHMQLMCHYIQLSQPEADALQLKDQHVRLVKQIQHIKNTLIQMPDPANGSIVDKLDHKIDLSFLHPVQTLWVVLRDPEALANNEYFHYLGKEGDDITITAMDLVINGTSRMTKKIGSKYNKMRLQNLFHGHSKRSDGEETHIPAFAIDFALNGQSNNPSGHINFSNAATQQLKIDFRGKAGTAYVVDIYAVGLNWVNLQGGTAKVVFN